jgi:ribose-phosphate pyrophosphokinase
MKLFTGSANPPLAERIAEYIGVPLGRVEIGRFPDGEISLKILENVRGEDVFAIQPTCPPPNDNLMELLIMIDALRRASAARITAVLPFYGYGRQDRKDQPRVPITAKLVANLLVAAGVNRILTVDLHAQQIQGFFDIPVDHLYASPVIVKHFLAKGLANLVVVSPDTGGMKMAHAYANMLNAGLAVVAKQRNGPADVQAFSLVGDVQGCHAVMVDDLVTTAGTICTAARFLKEHGALDVYAAVTHAVLAPVAIERLRDCPIKELVVTDTVRLPEVGGCAIAVLSVAELLGEAIIRIHDNQSVTSLFKIGTRGENTW